MGFVYFIYFTNEPLIKIGSTTSLQNRIKDLERVWGYIDTHLSFIIPVERVLLYKFERFYQNYFNKYKVNFPENDKRVGRTEMFDKKFYDDIYNTIRTFCEDNNIHFYMLNTFLFNETIRDKCSNGYQEDKKPLHNYNSLINKLTNTVNLLGDNENCDPSSIIDTATSFYINKRFANTPQSTINIKLPEELIMKLDLVAIRKNKTNEAIVTEYILNGLINDNEDGSLSHANEDDLLKELDNL